MIDYNAVKNTIAHEQNIELLRGVVAILLGEVEERRNRLAKLDPLAEPAFRRERSDATRSQMAATQNIDVMRSMARDLYQGVEALNVQIAQAENGSPTKSDRA